MKDDVFSDSDDHSILKELVIGALLLGVSLMGGWLANDLAHPAGGGSEHWRLLLVLLVQPFALAAWVFFGLPGLGLTVSSMVHAMQDGRPQIGILGAGVLAVAASLTVSWY